MPFHGSQTTPQRSTAESQLDAWNQAFRQSPIYLDFMRANNLPTGGRVRLSRGQQAALTRRLAEGGIRLPGGIHIDQGGNLNQKNRTGKIAIGAAAGLTAAFGVPGLFPGVFSGGGAAAGGTTSALPAGWTSSVLAPPGVTAGATGATTAGVAGAAAGLGKKVLGTLGERFTEMGLNALTGLPAYLVGRRRSEPSAREGEIEAKLLEALARQEEYQTYQGEQDKYSDPLRRAVTRSAGALLPSSAWGAEASPYGSA